ncbi:MAG: acetylxylan esterase [Acidobacteria bacterium]|nr:acetylxylan esterase [Acidobacteriota bacterium]
MSPMAFSHHLRFQAVILCAVLQLLEIRTDGAESRQWKVLPDTNALDTKNVMPNSIALSKALVDAAEHVLRWQLPRDADEWRPRRSRVDLALRKAMGLQHLPERGSLAVRIQARHDLGDYWLTNVIFHSRSDFPVTGNLYVPKNSGSKKLPAVLCPVGHYLAAGKGAKENQILCIKLVKLGFAVLTYDAIGQGERLTQGNIHHEAGFALLPLGQTIAGWMVWDSLRALDFLQTLSQVDPERIGITGNSGGGLNSLLTAALDQRIRAAAVAGYVFEFNNWIKYGGPHCTCTCLPGLYQEMEWFEIAGLIAPRAVLMLQGDRDNIFPISGARRAGRNTEALFALLGHPRQARFDDIAGQPHAYSRPFRERTYGWLLHHLADEDDASPSAEGQISPLDESDPRLICDPGRAVLSSALSVVELARKQAKHTLAAPAGDSKRTRAAVQTLVDKLSTSPDPDPDHLLPHSFQKLAVPGGFLEKVSFLSEVGLPIPGLLWYPGGQPPFPTVVIVDSRGKGP